MPGVDLGSWGRRQPNCSTQCGDQQQHEQTEDWSLVQLSPGQSKPTQNPACSKHHCLPSGCSRVGYVQLRPFSNSRSSPDPYSERRPHPRGDSRHQSQAPAFNFSLVVFLFLSIEQIETPEQLERGAEQWKVRNKNNVGKAHATHGGVPTKTWGEGCHTWASFRATWHGQPRLSKDGQAGSKALCSQPATNQHPNKCFMQQ